jgi:diguanylate cyclase (GGDEF)-like protein/PAS domain S-box-containing protein
MTMMDKSCQSIDEVLKECDRLRQELADAERAYQMRYDALRAKFEKLAPQLLERTEELEQKNQALTRHIAERERIENALKESEERYQRLVSAITAYVYTVEIRDGQAIETTHSMGCFTVTGYTPEDYIADPFLWYTMIHPEDRPVVAKHIGRLLSGQDFLPFEHRLVRRDAKIIWVRNTMVSYRDAAGRIIRYDGLIEDITKHKAIEEKLRASSTIDDLTGLHNRRGFLDLAQQQFWTAERLNKPLLLFFADLDGLKLINDNFGHSEGDAALIQTAKILKASFRESDIIGRMGGDEFAALALEKDPSSAERIVRRIQKNIDEANLRRPQQYLLSVSIGVARCDDENGTTLEDLLVKADARMYDQKQRKKEAR